MTTTHGDDVQDADDDVHTTTSTTRASEASAWFQTSLPLRTLARVVKPARHDMTHDIHFQSTHTTAAALPACGKPATQSVEYDQLKVHVHENINVEIHELNSQQLNNHQLNQNIRQKMLIHMTLRHAAVPTHVPHVRPSRPSSTMMIDRRVTTTAPCLNRRLV